MSRRNIDKRFSSDIHRDTTFTLALDAGFDATIARVIANANDLVDGRIWYDGIKWAVAGSKQYGFPHYMCDEEENREYNWKMAESLIQILLQIACRNLINNNIDIFALNLGRALHTLQDRYSHTLETGEPMTDAEHGIIKGTDNITKRFHLKPTVVNNTKKILREFYGVFESRECPMHRKKLSSPCKFTCKQWLQYKDCRAPFW